MSTLIENYISLGLQLNKHIDGLVDAYYGPRELADRVLGSAKVEPEILVENARQLINAIDSRESLDSSGQAYDSSRAAWLRGQVVGLMTTAQKLAGVNVDYVREVELCYGVKPRRVSSEEIDEALGVLDRRIPGVGSLGKRLNAYRSSFEVPPELLKAVLMDLKEILRDRTLALFGLPEGESLEFEIVKSKPWSGFNYYLGNLKSRVAINADLPVLSTSLAHLVAHEAYPGHHSEHTRKEADLYLRRRQLEESIFLVGTPQCLIAEGLADFGLEIALGDEEFSVVSELMIRRGVNYPDQEMKELRGAFETLSKVRANAAWDLHQDGAPPDTVVESLERDALLSRPRAEKAVEFLTDPIWRAYITCYVEGFQLVRSFVGAVGQVPDRVRVERFKRLITEQVQPQDLNF
ncbi:MAG: DUF885 domain-containing protein [Actinomycetota bacterium]|nr:MAG: DUF885 domain-containing protein [Actinomycetota bacterium]